MTTRTAEPTSTKRKEWQAFLILTLIILPALAVIFVGSYGFVVWMSHEIYGPPVVTFETQPVIPPAPTTGAPLS